MRLSARRAVAAAFAAPLLAAGPVLAQGSTWWVDVHGTAPGSGTPGDPYTSIHYAVQQPTTVDGDTVLVLPGYYRETVEIVHKAIALRSTHGPDQTTIDAVGEGTVLTVVGHLGSDVGGGVVVDGFTLQGGSGTWVDGLKTGGGLLARDVEMELKHSILRENRAARGGGLAALVAYVDMLDVEVEHNAAETERGARDGQGGGIYADTTGGIATTEVRVRGNVAGVGGGIYVSSANLALTDSQILGNVAWGESFAGQPAQGGGVYAEDTWTWIAGSRVEENLAWGPNTLGGGLRFVAPGEAWLDTTEISRNAVGDWPDAAREWTAMGGGIASDVLLTATELAIRDNHAKWGGGGVYGAGTYSSCELSGNTARFGGAAYADDVGDCYAVDLSIADGAIWRNRAGALGQLGAGGGLFGPLLVTDSVVAQNVAYGNGGGAAGATFERTEIFENVILPAALETFAKGAGVYQSTVLSSVLRDNSGLELLDAATYGGGAADSTLTLTLIYDNEAQFGAGASNSWVDRCTVYGNRAGSECGGLFFDTSGFVGSSIVWLNQPQQIVDLAGVVVEYSDVQGGWPGVGNHSVNPMFWDPVARDFHLKPSSPCIDGGHPAVQDPDGTRCDVGALPYEAGYCGLPTTYCEAGSSSLGCPVAIGFQGAPSLTGPDDFVIEATGVRNRRFGLLAWGYNSGHKPFKGATLCITGPLIRTPIQGSGGSALPAADCTGTLSFALTQQYMDDHFLWHGRTIYAQFVYRDHGYQGDPHAVGTTEGLRVTICP